jgi:hypothetical protein
MKRQITATLLLLAGAAMAQDVTPTKCESCAAWNVPTAPYRIYGDTYYVGTRDLSAILITSFDGPYRLQQSELAGARRSPSRSSSTRR